MVPYEPSWNDSIKINSVLANTIAASVRIVLLGFRQIFRQAIRISMDMISYLPGLVSDEVVKSLWESS
jgi:hypothetical protein